MYQIETGDLYRMIAKYVEIKFDTNGYSKDNNRPLPIGRSKKVIRMIKDKLGRKIMTEIFALRAETHVYRKINKN